MTMGTAKTTDRTRPMLDAFLLRAGIAGIGVALAAAPLGCFVVWRRMAFFGDATAHAALLGVALALAFEAPIFVGALVIALIMALVVSGLDRRGTSVDTILGVVSHSALAFGLLAVAALPAARLDLSAYLFGDILAVSWGDIWVIWGGAIAVAVLMGLRWSALLTVTLDPDLAQAAGISPGRERLILTVALAVVVAVALKVVGALLIAALLIIPAAAARPLARTPEAMVAVAAALGTVAAVLGLYVSLLLDSPTGPTIVGTAAVIFAVTRSFGGLMALRNR